MLRATQDVDVMVPYSQKKRASDAIARQQLSHVASQVWERGGEDVLRFVELALDNKPFPV
ncbi:MAG: hypothetical protein KDA51_14795 [Planctomycetales bacterium]|nr:hypothetical protein [Planctomycetales bacterium]MCA9182728.1 hypothetical protein [Planctomycetales bacterium]